MRTTAFFARGRCAPSVFLPALLPLLFLLLSAAASAQPLYKYSNADKALIARTRKEEAKAEKAYDRRNMYRIAKVYEGIYDRYKDSSMAAAIRCYRFACQTEGDLDSYQHTAAYTLARIYELGKGTPKDPDEAMIFYFLSHDKGRQKLAQLKPLACKKVQLLLAKDGMLSYNDSLVFSLSPFCSVMKPEFQPQWKRVADLLRGSPNLKLEIATTWKMVLLSAPYDLLMPVEYLRQGMALQTWLTEKEGISVDRILFNADAPPADADRMVLRFIVQDDVPVPQPRLRERNTP